MDYEEVKVEAEKMVCNRGSITNKKGKEVKVRKYHMTPEQIESKSKKFWEETKHVSREIKEKAGIIFFNPYRKKGPFNNIVQALYLLGANDWHCFRVVKDKMRELMSLTTVFDRNKGRDITSWEKFEGKAPRNETTGKDCNGRIQHLVLEMQRLGGLYPYGYKLKQVQSCLDARKLSDGNWEYRLNTCFKREEDVAPLYAMYGDVGIPRKKGRVVVINEVKVS